MEQQGNDPTAPDQAEAHQAAETMVEHANEVASRSPVGSGEPGGLDLLMNVGLTVTVELGRSRMKISDILNLGTGSVVELQKLASEPVDVLVNDSLFARGEVVVMEDSFAVKITELVEGTRIKDLH